MIKNFFNRFYKGNDLNHNKVDSTVQILFQYNADNGLNHSKVDSTVQILFQYNADNGLNHNKVDSTVQILFQYCLEKIFWYMFDPSQFFSRFK